MANLQFDATHIDPTPRFDPLPAGDYAAIITESETRTTKDGSGQYLQIKIEVQGGEFCRRVLFDRLNLWNNNRQGAGNRAAVAIANLPRRRRHAG
jgi:hypothetical protein